MKPRQRPSRGKRADRLNFDETLVAAGKCGRPTRGAEANGQHCTLAAGWGTDHVGAGACKLHGGANPIVHGGYSEVARKTLGGAFERFKNDPNIASVEDEVAILRGLVERALEAKRDGEDVATLVDRVVRAVETMNKIRQKFGMTMEVFLRVTGQMGAIVAAVVQDSDALAEIERRWREIPLGS